MMDFHILLITLILIILDLLSGFLAAIHQKNVNSTKLRDGLWHKSGFIGLIVLAYIVEYAAQKADLGFDVPTVLAVCIYIIVTECVSIFENLCILNPKIVNSPLGSIFHYAPRIEDAEQLDIEEKKDKNAA